MASERLEYWQGYVEACQPFVGLDGWWISITSEHSPDGFMASIQVSKLRRIAFLKLGSAFDTYTPEAQRRAITHELVHCWTEQLMNTLLMGQEKFAPVEWMLFYAAMDESSERMTEGIAAVLAHFLPLPNGTYSKTDGTGLL